METNGTAHIFLTAANFERSRAFCRKWLPFLGLTPMIDSGGGVGVSTLGNNSQNGCHAVKQ